MAAISVAHRAGSELIGVEPLLVGVVVLGDGRVRRRRVRAVGRKISMTAGGAGGAGTAVDGRHVSREAFMSPPGRSSAIMSSSSSASVTSLASKWRATCARGTAALREHPVYARSNVLRPAARTRPPHLFLRQMSLALEVEIRLAGGLEEPAD